MTKHFLQGNCQVSIFSPNLCQGNCQVNCVSKKNLQSDCQVNYLVKNYQIFDVNYCDFQVDLGQFWLSLVGYGQLWAIIGSFT